MSLKLHLFKDKVTSEGDGIIQIASSGLKIQFSCAVGAPFDAKAGCMSAVKRTAFQTQVIMSAMISAVT